MAILRRTIRLEPWLRWDDQIHEGCESFFAAFDVHPNGRAVLAFCDATGEAGANLTDTFATVLE